MTIMKFIHRIQCCKHLNPICHMHTYVTESLGLRLPLVAHTCAWCCTPATGVAQRESIATHPPLTQQKTIALSCGNSSYNPRPATICSADNRCSIVYLDTPSILYWKFVVLNPWKKIQGASQNLYSNCCNMTLSTLPLEGCSGKWNKIL